MPMSRSTAALLVLGLYGAAMIAIALWGGRRTHNGNDFFLASRRLSTWFVAFSHVANATPAWLLLAFAGAAFTWGLSAVWIWIAVVAGYVLNGFYVAPRLRQLSVGQGSLTLAQVLSADGGDACPPGRGVEVHQRARRLEIVVGSDGQGQTRVAARQGVELEDVLEPFYDAAVLEARLRGQRLPELLDVTLVLRVERQEGCLRLE